MASEIHELSLGPITAHAFNADRSQLAVSPNSNEVEIYSRAGGGWKLGATLSEHDKIVTSIDWAPKTNRIVTCSQDRNAYVWTLTPNPQTDEHEWKPTLVLLRINRAATSVRWSPEEDKFAVGSGARTIAVCSFESESDWWVAKHLKRPIRSTVLSIDWHPNNVLLAAGSADSKARVFSAFIKGVDKKPPPTPWGEKLPFNTVCGEYGSPAGGWVHDVAFSPSGEALAFCSHDSTITIVYPSAPEQPPAAVVTVKSPSLPYVSLLWTSEVSIVAAGHDCVPMLFSRLPPSEWAIENSKCLDDPLSKSASAATGSPARAAPVGRLNNEAFNRFRASDTRGAGPGGSGGSASGGSTELDSVHQNTITSVRAYSGSGVFKGIQGEIDGVSTIGKDGKLVIWNVQGGVGGITAGVGRMGF